MFDDSIKNNFTLSFDSWSTDRKTVNTQLEYQVDIGTAQNINSSKYLIVFRQTAARVGVPNEKFIFAIFDNLKVRHYPIDINGVRYLRDGVNIDYTSDDYLDRYRDLKQIAEMKLGKNYLILLLVILI